MLRDHGCLRAFISDEERGWLSPDSLDEPAAWEGRDPDVIGPILARALARLREENERLPVHHFLWFVDEEGERWGGMTQIIIPFGGIELAYPQDPIVKLDGGHGDPLHRLELQKFRVRVDPVRLGRYTEQLLRRVAEQGLTGGTYVIDGPPGNR